MKKTQSNRHRINVDTGPEIQIAIRALADRWNFKTNEAVTRAILECLHKPLATAPEPPWAIVISRKLDILQNTIEETFS